MASEQKLPGIRHLVAVASGKGGVGKSTVTVNLALALRRQGAAVGIVDADILGPSIPVMMGLPRGQPPPVSPEGKGLPLMGHGIKVMSMGMLTGDDEPAILRGPLVTKYLRMFIDGVDWGKLDYLLLDLPPGTGDVQLTLAQSIPLSGAVVVTTPQDVSLNIARRGLRMFEKVAVPILGIVENMSSFACPHCGKTTDVFRRGGGERMGQELGVPFLGAVPLDAEIVMSGDEGLPIVAKKPESAAGRAYTAIAEQLAARLEQSAQAGLEPFVWQWDSEQAPPWREELARPGSARNVPVGLRRRDARTLSVLWQDGRRDDYDLRDLRLACACALCVDEVSGRKLLDPQKVRETVSPRSVSSLGNYAVGITWDDGHSSGIYTFERLRELGDRAQGAFDV